MRWTLTVGALAFLAALPAMAATIQVPGDFLTIQGAVDAAAAGDRVKVFPGAGTGPNGEYEENVVIDTTPIILHCVGTVIDVSTTTTTRGGVDFSAGITVTVDGVEVRGCTVQFAQNCDPPLCPNNPDDGDGIDVDANDFTATQIVVKGNQRDGVVVDGHFARLLNSTSRGNGERNSSFGGSFVVRGHDASLSGLMAEGSNRGIVIEGDRNSIDSCRAERNEGNGFQIIGSDNQVTGNLASVNGNRGFIISGDRNTLDENVALTSGNAGFEILSGMDLVMTRNESKDHLDHGFLIREVVDATVADNLSDGNYDSGFDCFLCESTVFRRNVARANREGGFRVYASSITFDANRSVDNHGDGFRASSCNGAVVFVDNVATRNGGDGIDVDCVAATDVVISDNTVNYNVGTGIENDAQGSDVTGNRLQGNRTDIAGTGDETPATGTVGAFAGNVFRTGGAAVATPGTGVSDP